MHEYLRQDSKTTTTKKMMNALAVCVIVSSVAAAGFWSPSPITQTQSHEDQVIVREGHRVVVVEYDENGHHNTKVSISAHEDHYDGGRGGELICDAYGKCKQKILSAFGKATDTDTPHHLKQGANHAKDRSYNQAVKDGAYNLKDSVGNAIHKVKDKAKDRAHDANEAVKDRARDANEAVKDRTRDANEAVKDRAHDAKEAVKNRAHDAKEAVKNRAHDAKEAVKDRAHDAKEAVGNAIHKAKDGAYYVNVAAEDEAYKVSEAVGNAVNKAKGRAGGSTKDRAKEATREAKDKVYETNEAAKGRAQSAMSIIGLLGLATALGTSIWVSFVASYVLARAVGRNQFGVVQSKVYPVYFKVMACCIGTALMGHMMRSGKSPSPAEGYQAYNLSASLLIVLANLFLIEPRATKVMLERIKTHKEEGRGVGESETASVSRAVADSVVTSATTRVSVPAGDELFRARVDQLNMKLKRYNSCSSVLNLLTLMGLIWHLVYLNQLIQNCIP